jgi:hypothetical protein
MNVRQRRLLNETSDGKVNIRKDGEQNCIRVSRLVLLTFVGPSNLEVLHIDHNRLNHRLENLRWATHEEIILHTQNNLRNKKISDEKVIELLNRTDNHLNVAKDYAVCPQTICGIRNRTSRTYITAPSKYVSPQKLKRNPEHVQQIRMSKESLRLLAARYKVDPSTISLIRNNKRHVVKAQHAST